MKIPPLIMAGALKYDQGDSVEYLWVGSDEIIDTVWKHLLKYEAGAASERWDPLCAAAAKWGKVKITIEWKEAPKTLRGWDIDE